MVGLDRELETALKAMEASFHVHLIGTFAPDLVWAPAEADATAWLAKNNSDFDQFPVKQGDVTVGILLRQGNHTGKIVCDAMQPLGERLIVSADMPIADLIPQLHDNHYRIVLRGSRIDGLVTQSDLLKLPVRLVLFALITHLEHVMADVISTHWPSDSWLAELSKGRQSKILCKESELRDRGMNPPRIELTEFSDKRDLCKRLIDGSKSAFQKGLEDLRDLRDQLVHAATFVNGSDGKIGATALVNKFESAKHWIDQLSKLTSENKASK